MTSTDLFKLLPSSYTDDIKKSGTKPLKCSMSMVKLSDLRRIQQKTREEHNQTWGWLTCF